MFGGHYYNGSGYTQSSDIFVFDTETETKTYTGVSFDNGISAMGCVVVGTKIYLFGGYRIINSKPSYSNAICVFDTETNTLSTLITSLPFACGEMACCLVGTKIYLFGGSISNTMIGRIAETTDKIVIFDIETKTVTTLDTKLPTTCCAMGYGAIGAKIYLFGGQNDSALNTINAFNTENETITTLSTTLPVASSFMGTITIANKIYMFGGANDNNSIKVFTLTHELANGDIELQSGLLKNKFNLINTENNKVKIGVENVYIGNGNNEAELCEAYLHNGTEWVVIK